jgi:2-polyprenyl-3-methyl-5-hydroxy-6-metoxy-1,4-benzoquinol methylase
MRARQREVELDSREFVYDNRYYEEGIGGFHKASIPHIHHHFEKLRQRHATDAILDFGCGNGFHSAYLKSQSNILHGVDFSDAIQQSGNKANYQQLFQTDLGKETSLPSSFYDLLFSIEVIEHVSDYRQFLKNAHKALKPGGVLFLTTTTYFWSIFVMLIVYRRKTSFRTLYDFFRGWLGSEKHKTRFVLNFWDYFTGHYHGFSKRQLLNAFKETGFRIRTVKYLPIQPVVPLHTLEADYKGPHAWLFRIGVPLIKGIGKLINYICLRTGIYTPNILVIAEK